MFHARNPSLLWNCYNQSGFFFFCLHLRSYTMRVCAICLCVFWKRCVCKGVFKSRTATVFLLLKAVPHLGSAAIPQAVKGFSEALLIGCNLLFFQLKRLRNPQPWSLQAINAKDADVASHNRYVFSCGFCHIWSQARLRGALTLPALPGPWCKQLLSRRGGGSFWGKEALRGDLVWILKCPWGWWRDLGIGWFPS